MFALFVMLTHHPARAQQSSAVCTFNNIGVEVILTSAPPAGTSISMAVRENGVLEKWSDGKPDKG